MLAALGGDAELLGENPGLVALHDLGMLDIFFNGMVAFLHAVALVGSDGVPAVAFLPFAQRILEVLTGTLPGLVADIDRGRPAGLSHRSRGRPRPPTSSSCHPRRGHR